jgi:hypothetical protein
LEITDDGTVDALDATDELVTQLLAHPLSTATEVEATITLKKDPDSGEVQITIKVEVTGWINVNEEGEGDPEIVDVYN